MRKDGVSSALITILSQSRIATVWTREHLKNRQNGGDSVSTTVSAVQRMLPCMVSAIGQTM